MAFVLTRQYLLTLVLLFTSAGTGANAALGTINYFQFFPALQQLQVSLTDLQWSSTSLSLNITVGFSTVNPTDYNGISLNVLRSFLEIVLNDNDTIIQSVPQNSLKGPLTRNTPLSTSTSFVGTTTTPQRVAAAIASGADIIFVFYVDLILNTFLDRAASTIVSYTCQSRTGPGTCVQTLIQINPSRDFTSTGVGGGGGGGAA